MRRGPRHQIGSPLISSGIPSLKIVSPLPQVAWDTPSILICQGFCHPLFTPSFPVPDWISPVSAAQKCRGHPSLRACWEEEALALPVPCWPHGVHHLSLSACILLSIPQFCAVPDSQKTAWKFTIIVLNLKALWNLEVTELCKHISPWRDYSPSSNNLLMDTGLSPQAVRTVWKHPEEPELR
jgi:hypothetical protein